MSTTVYIMVAFFAPFLIVALSMPIAMWQIRAKNEKTASNHVQVCILSDNVDKKYYLCDEPRDGVINIIDKKKSTDGKNTEETGKTLLALRSHPGYYPAQGWKQIRAPIKEYYGTDSFIPYSVMAADPLEAASALFGVEHQQVTKVVVHEAHERKDESKKLDKAADAKGMSSLAVVGVFILIVLVGVNLYMTMRGGGSTILNQIFDGLKSVGIIK